MRAALAPVLFGGGLVPSFQITPANIASEIEGGGLTYSRGTVATTFTSDGVLRYAPHNLLSDSDVFVWTAVAVTKAKNLADPLGGTAGVTVSEGFSTGPHNVNRAYPAVSAGITSLAIYLKWLGDDFPYLEFDSGGGVTTVGLSLTSSGLTTNGDNRGSGLLGVTITAEADGWYRVAFSKSNTQANFYLNLKNASGAGGFNYTGTGRSLGVFAPQVNQGLLQPYYPSKGTAFYGVRDTDYSYGSEPLVLLEPQATNLVTWSTNLSDVSWLKTGATCTATRITGTAGGYSQYVQKVATTATGYLTFAASITPGTVTSVRLYLYTASPSAAFHGTFDLVVGTAVGGSTGAATPTVAMRREGAGWRCSVTGTLGTGGGNVACVIYADNGYFDCTYIQLETGTAATSYIPTSASQVTRGADSLSAAIPALVPGWNASGGTFVADYVMSPTVADGALAGVFMLHPVTAGAYLAANAFGNRTGWFANTAGAAPTVFTGKRAVAFNASGRFDVASAGSLAQYSTSDWVGASTLLRIGMTNNAPGVIGFKSLTYYPKDVSVNDLQKLAL